jgi:cyanophycinase-like exopeptidase
VTLLAGSLAALSLVIESGSYLSLDSDTEVVIVPTAAAFVGAAQAAIECSQVIADLGARIEALMVLHRASSEEEYFARRVREAHAVVLCDGSALHAKSVWRDTAVGEAIREARTLVAVGSVASVLGETMIDPRGGAPGVGLGYRSGIVVTVPQSEDQLARARSLLGRTQIFTVLGPTGVLLGEGESWRRVEGEVTATRGEQRVEL